MAENSASITQVLNKWANLNSDEKNKIIKQLYPELKKIASIQLKKNNRELTQNTTEVVNEAYIKMLGQHTIWKNRSHFFAVSATVMRRIVVDLTRKKMAVKHGKGIEHIQLEEVEIAVPFHFENWIVLDDAINKLSKINPVLSSIVEMKVIMDMSLEELSIVLGISLSTVSRHWQFAKAWLAEYLNRQ